MLFNHVQHGLLAELEDQMEFLAVAKIFYQIDQVGMAKGLQTISNFVLKKDQI